MGYQHCDKHDCDATNGCSWCELESDLEAREKLEHALRLLRQVQLHPKVSNRVVCAIVPIQKILKLLE
jgi:hypothetical protein